MHHTLPRNSPRPTRSQAVPQEFPESAIVFVRTYQNMLVNSETLLQESDIIVNPIYVAYRVRVGIDKVQCERPVGIWGTKRITSTVADGLPARGQWGGAVVMFHLLSLWVHFFLCLLYIQNTTLTSPIFQRSGIYIKLWIINQIKEVLWTPCEMSFNR